MVSEPGADRRNDPVLADINIDTIAWQFLCSHYTRREYWDWPLEQRIDAYLRHIDHADLLRESVDGLTGE